MPEHAPAAEQTLRLDTGRPSLRRTATRATPPAPETPPAAAAPVIPVTRTAPPAEERDDTRPVGREWMQADATAEADTGLTDDTLTDAVLDAPLLDQPAVDQTAVDGTALDDTVLTETVLDRPLLDAPPAGGDDEPPADVPPSGPGGPGGPGGALPRRRWRRPAVLAPTALVAVLAVAYGGDLLLTGGDVPRHTVVDGVDIGGLAPAAAEQKLQRELTPRLATPHPVTAGSVHTQLTAADAGLRLDAHATVTAARRGALSPWSRVSGLVGSHEVTPVLTGSPTDLDAAVTDLASQVDQPAVEATVAVQGATAAVVPAADGLVLDHRAAAAAITAAAARPGAPIQLPLTTGHPHVSTAAAQQVLDATVRPALAAPVSVVSTDGRDHATVPPAALGAALTFTAKPDGTLAVGLDPAKLQAALGAGFVGFGTPARDASFAVSGGSIHVVPSVDGTGIDPAALAAQLLPVLTCPAPRQVTAQLGPVHAAFTTEMAQGLGIKEQISSFTTQFAPTPSGTNIRVVAAKVDGAVVKPGETFSLNAFTGPRGTAQGYVPAAVIEGGKFTKAVGGGISQFATTMFNAEFFAGVQDVHHQPHSYWITRYPAGREATVFDGLIDLAWKNDSDTGIYIQTTWVQGSITVTFWGTKHYDIESVSGARSNVVDPQVQEAPAGPDCTPMSGQQGFDITVTRVFHPVGSSSVVRRQDFHTHYKTEPILHCVPTGAPAPAAPAGGVPDGTTPAAGPSPSARRPGRRPTRR